MTTHTPKPWAVGSGGGITGPTTPRIGGVTVEEARYWREHQGATGIPTAMCHEVVRHGKEVVAIIPASKSKGANALLISAAPDLLASCHAWLDYADEFLFQFDEQPDCVPGEKMCSECERVGCIQLKIRALRDALTKAGA